MACQHEHVLSFVNNLPEDLGFVRDRFVGEDPRLFIIYDDNPTQVGRRFAIAVSISQLIEANVVRVLAFDGSEGFIDLSVVKAFPDLTARRKVAEKLMRELKVNAVEFCGMVYLQEVSLWGVDDSHMYIKSVRLMQSGKIDEARGMQTERALAITDNLTSLTHKKNAQVMAVTLCGTLPGLVCTHLKERNISFVRILGRDGVSDVAAYMEKMNFSKRLNSQAAQPPNTQAAPVPAAWIETYCPHCGKQLRIPERYAGQTGKCSFCQNRMTVTAPLSHTPSSEASGVRGTEPRHQAPIPVTPPEQIGSIDAGVTGSMRVTRQEASVPSSRPAPHPWIALFAFSIFCSLGLLELMVIQDRGGYKEMLVGIGIALAASQIPQWKKRGLQYEGGALVTSLAICGVGILVTVLRGWAFWVGGVIMAFGLLVALNCLLFLMGRSWFVPCPACGTNVIANEKGYATKKCTKCRHTLR